MWDGVEVRSKGRAKRLQEMVEVKTQKFLMNGQVNVRRYIFLSGGIEITEITSLVWKYQRWPAKEGRQPK